MSRARNFVPFRNILVPVIYGCDYTTSLAAARLIAGHRPITLVGLVAIQPGESLSAGAAPARQVRKLLRDLADDQIRHRARVRVSYSPWDELKALAQQDRAGLLVLDWPCGLESLFVTAQTVLTQPVCDVVLVRGPLPERPERLLVPIRGGPQAALALRLSLAIAASRQAHVTVLHSLLPGSQAVDASHAAARQDAPFRGLARVLANLPEVERREVETADPAATILAASPEFDAIIIGAAIRPAESSASLGPVADRILRESKAGVMVVRTRGPVPAEVTGESAGQVAISVLVDKWFAENTYHADEFADVNLLLSLKRQLGLTISLALPALDEEETVGNVLQTLKTALVDEVPLVDEMVLMDSASADSTRDIASGLGIPVHIHQATLPRYGARRGKGEALWKSLYVTGGDLIVWIDTDIVNIHPRFVYGLLGPLLSNPRVQFVKGFYRRPLRVGDKIQAGGGGRVTELTARPLLNLFYPELSGVVQPLSGEYGGRRSALEQMPFFSGYGVEIGLLVDIFEKHGLSAIAQVDLQERIHHNQPLEALSKMSFAIIQAVIRRLERRSGGAMLEDVNKTMKLIRYAEEQYFLDIEEIAEQERPPMIEIEEYRARRG